jgi:hypothetical protein
LLTGAAASYRIGGRTPGAMPMVGELPRFLAERARGAARRG